MRKKSLFGVQKFPVRLRREFGRIGLKLQAKFRLKTACTADFSSTPCKIPCYRESAEPIQSDGNGASFGRHAARMDQAQAFRAVVLCARIACRPARLSALSSAADLAADLATGL